MTDTLMGTAFIETGTGKVVIIGQPDGRHNCDEMHCSSLEHVVARFNIASAYRADQRFIELWKDVMRKPTPNRGGKP